MYVYVYIYVWDVHAKSGVRSPPHKISCDTDTLLVCASDSPVWAYVFPCFRVFRGSVKGGDTGRSQSIPRATQWSEHWQRRVHERGYDKSGKGKRGNAMHGGESSSNTCGFFRSKYSAAGRCRPKHPASAESLLMQTRRVDIDPCTSFCTFGMKAAT